MNQFLPCQKSIKFTLKPPSLMKVYLTKTQLMNQMLKSSPMIQLCQHYVCVDYVELKPKPKVRYRSRFFVQPAHETTYVCMNQVEISIFYYIKIYQNHQQPPKRLLNSDFKKSFFNVKNKDFLWKILNYRKVASST